MSETSPSPCDDCAVACCKTLIINVNVVDLARITRGLRLRVKDVLARFIEDDKEVRPHVFYIQNQPSSLALKPPPGHETGCPFLMEIGSTARCGIYDFRPGVCRTYPFKRREGRVYHKRGTPCPRRFKIAPDDPQLHQAFDDYRREEWQILADFCREWNTDPPRYPSSFTKLTDFIEEILASGRV